MHDRNPRDVELAADPCPGHRSAPGGAARALGGTPSPHKFTRLGSTMTYLPGVARPPYLWLLMWAVRRGEDVEMQELRAGRSMSPRWLRVFPPAWWALVGWSARFPVGYDLTGSSDRQPGTQGSGSKDEYSRRSRRWRCPWGASVAPPPIFPPAEPATAATAESRGHSQRPVDTGHCARLPASPPPVIRKRVVLLPHAQIEPADTQPHNRRTGRATDMNQGDSQRHPTRRVARG